MEIYGIGIDLIEVIRVKDAIEKFPRFLGKIFTDEEIKYCLSKGKNQYQSFASRFAAKEAAAKSLGKGLGNVIFFKEIEVLNYENGMPYIILYNKTKNYCMDNNIKEIKITLSSTEAYCVASAISFKG
jgi:holo-[acyl-carrier protein] synthase